MPQVTFTMSADESRAVQGFLKVAEAQKVAEQGMRNLTAAGRENLQQLQSMHSGMQTVGDIGAAALSGLKGAVEGVTAAMGVMAAAGNAALEKMQEKTRNLRGEVETLQQALAMSGQTSMLPEIQQQLAALGSQYYTTAQLGGMFKQAQALSKGKVGSDVMMQAVGEAAIAGEAGKDPTAFMNTYMRLATGALKGADKTEISDTTAELLRAMPGGLDDGADKAIGRMTASGVDPYDALRFITAAARSDEGAKSLNTLLEMSGKQVADPRAQARAKDLEGQLREIEDRRTAIEADDLSMLPKHKRDAAQRDRRAELKELSSQATSVRREIQDLREAKVRLPGLTEMGRNPELLDEMGKAAYANLAGEVDAGEFTTESAGLFGRDVAEARGARNSDARLLGLSRLRALEVRKANRASKASVSDVAGVLEMAELDDAVAKSNGVTKAIFNSKVPGLGVGVSDISRGMFGAAHSMPGGAARGDAGELYRVQIVSDETRKPSVARNGSNEPAGRRQR